MLSKVKYKFFFFFGFSSQLHIFITRRNKSRLALDKFNKQNSDSLLTELQVFFFFFLTPFKFFQEGCKAAYNVRQMNILLRSSPTPPPPNIQPSFLILVNITAMWLFLPYREKRGTLPLPTLQFKLAHNIGLKFFQKFVSFC